VELQNQWYIFYGDIVKVYTIITWPFVILFSIVTLFVLTTELITKSILTIAFLIKIAYGLAIFLGYITCYASFTL
jgi:hypothetical protein